VARFTTVKQIINVVEQYAKYLQKVQKNNWSPDDLNNYVLRSMLDSAKPVSEQYLQRNKDGCCIIIKYMKGKLCYTLLNKDSNIIIDNEELSDKVLGGFPINEESCSAKEEKEAEHIAERKAQEVLERHMDCGMKNSWGEGLKKTSNFKVNI